MRKNTNIINFSFWPNKPIIRISPRSLLLLACVSCCCSCLIFADTEYTIDELFEGAMQTPELIEHIDEFIEANPQHPQILELKLFRTGQLQGLSLDSEHLKLVISEYKMVANEAGGNTEIAFKCEMYIGDVLFHCLNDFQAAYRHYKELEKHPTLAGHNLQVDCKRLKVYERIAASAFSCRDGKSDEVEKYTRLVMAYPYLGIEDWEMYKEFYWLFNKSAKLFLMEFADDLEKLMSIEIYPSHPGICLIRQDYIERLTSSDNIEDEMIVQLNNMNNAFEPPKAIEQLTSAPNKKENYGGSEVSIAEETNVNLLPASRSDSSSNHPKKWIVGGLAILVIAIASFCFLRKRNANESIMQ